MPRVEDGVLLAVLIGTAGAKLFVTHRLHVERIIPTLITVTLADVIFVTLMGAGIGFLYALHPGRLATRVVLIAVFLIAAYTAIDFIWMVGTGTQVHPDVIASFLNDPREFGGVFWGRLWRLKFKALPFLLVTVGLEFAVVARFVHPRPYGRGRKAALRRGAIFAAVALGAGIATAGLREWTQHRPKVLTIAGSAHWRALTSCLERFDSRPVTTRAIARRGQRRIVSPPADVPRPHVVLIVLESAAHWATSFGDQPADTTPTLTQLAEQGAYFRQTRACVTHTSKSLFTMLTGVTPSLEADCVEAVPVDPPYESLATILNAAGYRTRFAQMARGSFECRPGLVSNLGFNSFFARDDLNDPTTHVGYLGGDDFAMLAPTFAWLDEQEAPGFVVLLTSVAHDPYELPAWFGPPVEGRENAFLQTIRYSDQFVNAVLAEIEKRALRDDTLLCVLGDHGEGFDRRGVFGHNEDPFDEALHVPWIVAWPGRISSGLVDDVPRSTLDVTPTLLALLGYGIDEAGFEGSDAFGPIDATRRVPFAGWYANSPAGYVAGLQKVVYWPASDTAFRFQLGTDPLEEVPIPVDSAELAALRTYLRERRQRCRIAFDPRSTHEHVRFDCWRVVAAGDNAWSYYVCGD